MTKPVRFSKHALEQMAERGATQTQVVETIRNGEIVPAKKGRLGYRKNFEYNQVWGKRKYANQQVLAIVVEENDALVVVTVYTFYF